MHNRPKLLFLSHRIPYPPHNGAAIRTYNILRLLARDFDVTGLCFDRPDIALLGLSTTERLSGMETLGVFESIPIPQARSLWRFGWDHTRSIATGRPYTWYIHDSSAARRRLRELLSSRAFALVHVDSMDLVALLPQLTDLPVALTHHNVESALLKQRAKRSRNPASATYLGIQSTLLRRAEQEWLPLVAANIAVSDADAADFRRIAPGARVEVIPNGVDTDYFVPVNGPTAGCVFVGGTSWYPNLDGLEWFVAEVLPLLRNRGMTEEVTWVGRATDAELEHYNKIPGLRLTGYVPDIRPYVHAASCFIAPLRVGGGTRLKLLDAWAMGKAIVSTSQGAEGLRAIHGANLFIADSAEDFADSVLRVLQRPAERRQLETAGRSVAEDEYSWEVLGGRMRSLYMELLVRR